MRYTWMLPCAVLGGVLMAACQVLIYRYAPVEQTMGLVQKIFYTHLPLAWWSFVSFFLVCVSGVAYLKTRNRHWDAVAGAAAEVGVVLSGLALVSGSIWARHSWGVWWTWDPRLTTTMILWFPMRLPRPAQDGHAPRAPGEPVRGGRHRGLRGRAAGVPVSTAVAFHPARRVRQQVRRA